MKAALVLSLCTGGLALPVWARDLGGYANPHEQGSCFEQEGGHGHARSQFPRGEPRRNPVRPDTGFSVGITVGGAHDLVRDVGIRPGSYRALPPGMHNRLAKGKPLPPGIAKKQVPPAMLARLPVPPGHEWLVIGVDLVLVNARTRIAVDILPRVF